jgi:mycoredoxin
VTDTTTPRAALTVYTTSWCGPCARLKQRLRDHGVAFHEVDVEHDPEAAEWVMRVNSGNRTVPTVRFADGGTLTNPPIDAVLARLGDQARAPQGG